jgi:predicted AlkP superfamily pyrophosphatase or phosphodiesterase
MRNQILRSLFLSVVLACSGLAQKPGAVVLISIDGLANRYMNEADSFHLKVPALRRIFTQGAHASGVIGVFPTVTYPNHTTLITGAAPARHGILQNTVFDPEDRNIDGWYWYAQDIRVPTLWDVAAAAGYVVGSVSWPVSVGARGVSALIPEYWRAANSEDRKLLRALSTPGMMAELEPQAGPYITDLNDAINGDWARTHWATAIIHRRNVRFITVHLAALDHLEHEAGPYSPTAFATLEEIDKMVAEIEKAMRQEAPETVMCIVSDHGFAAIDHQLSLRAAFVKAGLLTVNANKHSAMAPTFSAWKAAPWGTGGSAFVVLKDPNDAAVRTQVEKLLRQLESDPANGIDHIMSRSEIAKLGAAPKVDFAVDMKPGFSIGSSLDTISGPIKPGGTHGFSPTHPEMRASFAIAGPGIREAVNLGEIDMRSIASALAELMGGGMMREGPRLEILKPRLKLVSKLP